MGTKTITEQVEDDIRTERIRQLEESVLDLSASVQHLTRSIQEMQTVIVRIATNQQQLAERVSTWPFVKVDAKKKRSPPKDSD